MKKAAVFLGSILLMLAMAAPAHATARWNVTCDRVEVNYTQFSSGTPGVAHLLVKVDDSGPALFDDTVSFEGSSYTKTIPLNFNDGRVHTVRVAHRWINRKATEWDEQREVGPCGTPPVETPSVQQEQPAPVPAPTPVVTPPAPPHPDSSDVPPTNHRKAHRRAVHRHRIRVERERHGSVRHRTTRRRHVPESTG